jgi:MFS family permease
MWFYNLAAALFIFRETGSEVLLGVLAFAQFVPVLLLSPWSGAAADRFDRRHVVMVAQVTATCFAAVVTILVWTAAASVAAVLVLSVAIGSAQAFTSTAGAAMIVSLVESADLASAVALNAMTFNLARAAGPALAAVAVTQLGIGAALAVGTVSFLALAIGVAAARTRPLPRAAGASARLRDTLALLRRRPRLAGYLLVVMVVGFASDPINTLAPAFAHAFDRPDTDAGLLIGVFGAGAVTAAFLLTGRAVGARTRAGGALLVMGVAMAGFSTTPWFVPSLALLFVAGFGYLACNATATARLQLEIEEEHRGRVMAVWSIAFLGMRPFASLADGIIAATLGVRAAGVALAVPAIVTAVWLLRRRSPRVRLRSAR